MRLSGAANLGLHSFLLRVRRNANRISSRRSKIMGTVYSEARLATLRN